MQRNNTAIVIRTDMVSATLLFILALICSIISIIVYSKVSNIHWWFWLFMLIVTFFILASSFIFFTSKRIFFLHKTVNGLLSFNEPQCPPINFKFNQMQYEFFDSNNILMYYTSKSVLLPKSKKLILKLEELGISKRNLK